MQRHHKLLLTIIPVIFLLGIIGYFYIKPQQPIEIQTQSGINQSIFSDLPPTPNNFQLIRRNFYDSQIDDFTKIPESVYKRPEFYPTWESNGIKWFTDHDWSRWGVHGEGTFPSSMDYSALNMSTNDKVTIYTFLHTSWGIESWQGFKVTPIYNETLFNAEISPDLILLEPTFPKFYYNWTHLLKYTITAKQKIPEGQYSFSISLSPPPRNVNEKWSWDVLDKYTNNLYTDEIQECKSKYTKNCDEYISLRQHKYVIGGSFVPDNIFSMTLNVK